MMRAKHSCQDWILGVCLLWLLQLLPICMADVDPIIIKGSRFFYKTNGSEFIVRGIMYQDFGLGSFDATQFLDPLSDISTCRRDIEYLSKLTVNVVQVTILDPTKDHTACMNALADAGIFVVAQLGNAVEYIASIDGFWTQSMLAQFIGVIEDLAPLNNLLGFYIGTVDEDPYYSNTWPFLKAALRDTKAYLREKNYRDVPIGWEMYTIDSYEDVSLQQVDYLTCDENRADFVLAQSAAICTDDNDIHNVSVRFGNATLPTMINRYGCVVSANGTKDNRTFEMASALYETEVIQNISGGFVRQYFPDPVASSNYGLVTLGDMYEISTLPGFAALSSVMATIEPSLTSIGDYTPTVTPAACPTPNANDKYFNASSILPPKPNAKLCSCMMESVRCVANPAALAKLNATAFYDQRQWVCQGNSSICTGTNGDGTKGKYGAFNACNQTEAWSWNVNKYWEIHGEGSCDINGTAELRDSPPPPSQECAFLLQQAGDNGQGTVTASFMPSSTGSPNTSGEKSLTTGAKAGIGLGVAAFVILVLLGILFVLHRKKQEKKKALGHEAMTDKPELDGSGVSGTDIQKHRVSELGDAQGASVEAPVPPGYVQAVNQTPVELPEEYIRGELTGSPAAPETRRGGDEADAINKNEGSHV